MTPALEQALTGNGDYDGLPESFKFAYSYKEWQWLSDREKSVLVLRETEPEWDE